MIRAFALDDEPLALKRLLRLLDASGRVEIVGSSTDPVAALSDIRRLRPQVVFLDIQMPEMTGFQLLDALDQQPLVVFTTAYDQYALKAFEVNSIDYLLKPVEEAQLDRALAKLGRVLSGALPAPPLTELLAQMKAALSAPRPDSIERIASRIGERVHFVDLEGVTHFYAEDKLTFAATLEKNWVVDRTITELEQKLDPSRFVRVHRSTLVNLAYVDELYPWFGGRMILRLKTPKKTEITVARERVRELKERLGL